MHPHALIARASRRAWLQHASAAFSAPLALSLLLPGCASRPPVPKPSETKPAIPLPPKPVPEEVALTLRVTATHQVNPDTRGRPSPLLLRVYLLRSARTFDTGDFMSLYQRDTQVLGDDLLGREEILVAPGGSMVIARSVPGTARVLAVLAAFRASEQARWRALVAMPPGQAPRLTLQADRLSVLFSEAG